MYSKSTLICDSHSPPRAIYTHMLHSCAYNYNYAYYLSTIDKAYMACTLHPAPCTDIDSLSPTADLNVKTIPYRNNVPFIPTRVIDTDMCVKEVGSVSDQV